MGLIEVQRALAQLYTSVELREKFLANPQEVAIEFGLTGLDIEHLTALSAFHLREFAGSLQHKRLGEVRKILTFTEKSLKTKFSELFLEFTNNYLPSGIKKHRDDAVAFAKFIASPLHKDIPDWSKEIAIYEATCLQLGETKKLLRVRKFRYPIKKIIQSLLQGEEIVITKKLTLAIWMKIPGQTRWYHYLISIPGFN
jgi:hypothetical protein